MNPITIAINTTKKEWGYLSLLLTSLENNLYNKNNEILIFIDTDTPDNLIENNLKAYRENKRGILPDIKIIKNTLQYQIGYQYNINLLFKIAKYDVVCYIQSDMVIAKYFDKHIISKLTPSNIISGTRIEPPLHGESDKTYTQNFGVYPTEFKYNEFIDYSNLVKDSNKVTNYFFAPFCCYKNTWNSIGGHDTRFRCSREDSDMVARFCLNGNEMIQDWSALVYHFTCTSSRGIGWFESSNEEIQKTVRLQEEADAYEVWRFVNKWKAFPVHDASIPMCAPKISLVLQDIPPAGVDYLTEISCVVDKLVIGIGEELDRVKAEVVQQLNMLHDKVANARWGINEEDARECLIDRYYPKVQFSHKVGGLRVGESAIVPLKGVILGVRNVIAFYNYLNALGVLNDYSRWEKSESGYYVFEQFGLALFKGGKLLNTAKENIVFNGKDFVDWRVVE